MAALAPDRPPFAISVRDLRKTFRLSHSGVGSLKAQLLQRRKLPPVEELEVLKGLTFDVNWGECVALLGRNGAGKSTLLSLLARVIRPTSGTVQVAGRVAPLLELGAGFHPDLTGLENAIFNGMMLGLTRAQSEANIDRVVEFSGLHNHIDSPLRNYSSGMVARLGFAVAINVGAEILIVDEVLAVGDFEFQAKCEEAISKFKSDGGTILFVSHSSSHVELIADRCLWLQHGQVIAEGPGPEILERYRSDSVAEIN